MDIELTKSAEYLLCILYREYKDRIKKGDTIQKATRFETIDEILSLTNDKWVEDDVFTICRSLRKAGCITYLAYDNTAYGIQLTDKAVIYMENRIANKAFDFLKHLSELRQALPFI